MQNHIYYFIEHDQIYYLFFSWSTYYYFYIFIEPSLRNTTIWPFSPFIIIFSYILPPKIKTQKPYNNKTSILFIIVIFHFLQPIYHHPPFFFLVSPKKITLLFKITNPIPSSTYQILHPHVFHSIFFYLPYFDFVVLFLDFDMIHFHYDDAVVWVVMIGLVLDCLWVLLWMLMMMLMMMKLMMKLMMMKKTNRK